MRYLSKLGGVRCVGAILLVAITGCTISIQPWTKQQPGPLPPPPSPDAGPWTPANALKNNGPSNQSPAGNNERTAEMVARLTEEQELRKALQDQVSALKKQLKDREDNLRLASYEMEETSKQTKRTRDDFRQWQGEMEELRDRIRKLEDYRSSAKPLIDDIYRILDRDKEPPRFKLPSSK